MCDYSLHAVASRPAEVGETIVTTTFRGTSTRGFASAADPTVAVCLLPGTELAFADNVRYDNRWIWTRTVNSRVGVKTSARTRWGPHNRRSMIGRVNAAVFPVPV